MYWLTSSVRWQGWKLSCRSAAEVSRARTVDTYFRMSCVSNVRIRIALFTNWGRKILLDCLPLLFVALPLPHSVTAARALHPFFQDTTSFVANSSLCAALLVHNSRGFLETNEVSWLDELDTQCQANWIVVDEFRTTLCWPLLMLLILLDESY